MPSATNQGKTSAATPHKPVSDTSKAGLNRPGCAPSARVVHPVQIVLFTVAAILLGALSLSPNGATRMLAWPWWGWWRVLLAIPPALLVLDLLTTRVARDWLRSTANAALAAFAAVHLLAGALSEHPQESVSAALPILSLCCLAAWVARRAAGKTITGRPISHILATAAASAAVAFAIVSLTSWLAGRAIPVVLRIDALNTLAGAELVGLELDGLRNERPLGHSSYVAGVGILALPWTLVVALRARSRRAQVGWAAGVVLVLLMLLTTQSRGAVMGFGAAAACALTMAARSGRWSPRQVVSAGIIGITLLAITTAAVPRLRRTVTDLAAGEGLNVGDAQRLAMLNIGSAMGAESWWIGQGPGLTARVYPEFRHTIDGGVDTALQLHSTPVQLWADTGLPGALAGAFIIGLPLVALMRGSSNRTRSDECGKEERLLLGAGAVSLVGYAAFALTDYQLNVPIIAAYLAINFGLLIGTRSRGSAVGERMEPDAGTPAALWRWCGAAACIGALGIAAMVTLPDWRARQLFAHAMDDLEAGGDRGVFSERALAATALQPDNPHFATGAAAALLRIQFQETDAATRDRLRAEAQDMLEHALAIEPNLEFAHFNLGWLLLANDPNRAALHFRDALRLVPDRGGVYFGLGLARLEAGDTLRAQEAFALEVLNDPAFITSPAWDSAFLTHHLDPTIERACSLAELLSKLRADADQRKLLATCDLLKWWQSGIVAEDLEQLTPPALPDPSSIRRGVSGLSVLRLATAHPTQKREILRRFILAQRMTPATEVELDVLERLVERHGEDWRQWLRTSEGREAPFARLYRRERPGFAMLAGNMDIPVPADAYVVQENGLVSLLLGSIFPVRGHLPDPLLVNHVESREL